MSKHPPLCLLPPLPREEANKFQVSHRHQCRQSVGSPFPPAVDPGETLQAVHHRHRRSAILLHHPWWGGKSHESELLLTLGHAVFLALFTISCLCTLIFQCVPPQAAFLLPRPADAQCFDNATFAKIGSFNGCEFGPRWPTSQGLTSFANDALLTTPAINVITDVLYVALPIPMVLKLQVNLRTKLSLIFALSLGLLYVYISCWAATKP